MSMYRELTSPEAQTKAEISQKLRTPGFEEWLRDHLLACCEEQVEEWAKLKLATGTGPEDEERRKNVEDRCLIPLRYNHQPTFGERCAVVAAFWDVVGVGVRFGCFDEEMDKRGWVYEALKVTIQTSRPWALEGIDVYWGKVWQAWEAEQECVSAGRGGEPEQDAGGDAPAESGASVNQISADESGGAGPRQSVVVARPEEVLTALEHELLPRHAKILRYLWDRSHPTQIQTLMAEFSWRSKDTGTKYLRKLDDCLLELGPMLAARGWKVELERKRTTVKLTRQTLSQSRKTGQEPGQISEQDVPDTVRFTP